MSHFYRQRSYSFNETDEMITELKKEMSNFLTKEEAELILNRRYALIDPNPYKEDKKYLILMEEINVLKNMFNKVCIELEEIKKKLDG